MSLSAGFSVSQMFQTFQLEDGATSFHTIFRSARSESDTDSDSSSEEEGSCDILHQCERDSGLETLLHNISHFRLEEMTKALPTFCAELNGKSGGIKSSKKLF